MILIKSIFLVSYIVDAALGTGSESSPLVRNAR